MSQAALLAAAIVVLGLLRHRLTKPLWYDEAWRAYQVEKPGGFWPHLSTSDGPYSFGYAAVLRLATLVFGSHEWALRLPEWIGLVALPVLVFALVRPVAGRLPALAAGASIVLNISILDFGTQLKPFALEGLAVVAMLLLWRRAHDLELTSPARLVHYAGLALCCWVAIPAVFVLAPLLTKDLIDAVRLRQKAVVLQVLVAAVPAVAHLLLFVAPQTALQRDPFWTPEYASSAGWMRAASHGLASVLPEIVTGTGRSDSTLTSHLFRPVAQPWRTVLVVTLVLLLLRGTVLSAASRAARPLLLGLYGGAACCFLSSAFGRWPFALERVNLFFVPLILALASTGLRWPVRSATKSRRHTVWLSGSLVVLLSFGWLVVLGTGIEKTLLLLRIGNGSTNELLERTSEAVSDARRWSGPNTLAVVHPQLVQPGWDWYMYRAQDLAHVGTPIPRERTVQDTRGEGFDAPGAFRNRDGDVTALLRRYPESNQILLFVLPRKYQPTLQQRTHELRILGWCPVRQRSYVHTGHLVDLTRC